MIKEAFNILVAGKDLQGLADKASKFLSGKVPCPWCGAPGPHRNHTVRGELDREVEFACSSCGFSFAASFEYFAHNEEAMPARCIA